MEKKSPTLTLETYKEFLSSWETLSKPEEKMRQLLDKMRSMISSEESTTFSFKDFWDAKHRCLDLFKEKFTSHARNVFWKEYIELSDEMKRLKKIIDEESAFSQEQLDLALCAIETDFEKKQERLADIPPLEIPIESKQITKNAEKYETLYREIVFLNALGQRIQQLRKEVIQTSMRMKQKNILFQRLKTLGDEIFPSRAALIDELSTLFQEDVRAFVAGVDKTTLPLIRSKEEIKTLQKFAKTLPLNGPGFTKSREALSSCWDRIKDLLAAHRDKKAQDRAKEQSQLGELIPLIDQYKDECQKETATLKEAEKTEGSLIYQLRALKLSGDLEKKWMKEIYRIKDPVEKRHQTLIEKQKQQEQEELKLQEEHLLNLASSLQELGLQADTMDKGPLVEKWEAFVKEEEKLRIVGPKRLQIEVRLGMIKDLIEEKSFRNLVQSTSEDRVPSMRALLGERHKEKRNIKAAIEKVRREVGGNSLSLEDSLLYQEILSEEKARLDAVDTLLEEIEETLFDLEG